MTDGEKCLERFISGDKEAFSEIIDCYRDGLIFFVYGYTRNMYLAEDIASESLAELYLSPKRFLHRSSLKTYLYSIAYHKTLKVLKRNSFLIDLDIGVLDSKTDDYIRFEDKVLKDEQAKQLHEALPKLKCEYRTALMLIYFEDMSYKEAADVMHKSVKQIDNYLCRGKAALKKLLLEEGFEYEE